MIPETIWNILITKIKKEISTIYKETMQVTEIRLRVGQPVCLCMADGEENGKAILTKADLEQTINLISRFSLYAYEEELRKGFITIQGGHRIGIVGKVVMVQKEIDKFKYIYAMNIRVAREVIGCAQDIQKWIYEESVENGYTKKYMYNSLIFARPGIGKTTVLRDLIRCISNQSGMKVGVIDERGELAAGFQGNIEHDLGTHTDVIEGCSKCEGMEIMVRVMAPKVVAMDELGTNEDVRAIQYGNVSGCKVIATAHAGSFSELLANQNLSVLITQKIMERYIWLHDTGIVIYNVDLEKIAEVNRIWRGRNADN